MGLFNRVLSTLGLRDPKEARLWSAALGYATTHADRPVTVDTALQLATVWACVRLISETVSTLPLFLYRRGEKDSRELAKDHALYGLIHDSPHADWTAVEFWEAMVASLCLWGNAYAEKRRTGSRVTSLLPMRADLVAIRRLPDGAREYRYHDHGKVRTLSEDDVFHIRGFGSGGDVGLSPIAMARQSLATAGAAEEHAAKTFANGVRPSGVLTIPQVLKPEQRVQVQENIVAPLAGSGNAGGVMVLEADFKFQPVTISPVDAEMLATRKFHVEDICRWFRVPPFMVGHTEKSTSWGTGIEQQMIGFLTFALRPYLTRIEQAIRRALLTPAERVTFYAEFSVEGLLRADSKSRADFYSKALGSGGQRPWMTVDEIRGLESWPAMGGEAATLQPPLNALNAPPPQE